MSAEMQTLVYYAETIVVETEGKINRNKVGIMKWPRVKCCLPHEEVE